MPTITDRLKRAWNAFANRDPTEDFKRPYEVSYYSRPDRPRFFYGQDKSLVSMIINTIAIDCATIDIKHVKVDENNNYVNTVYSELNDCLNVEANIDQTGKSFIQDAVESLLDEGCIAIVPTLTDVDPNYNNSFKVYALRVGKIIQWYPRAVKIRLYNDITGKEEEITMQKSAVAIVENPRYRVMNEPNSILKRLVRKINLLDSVDEMQGSTKLDLIIQVPYSLKNPLQKQYAEERRKDVELQLMQSKYGIAYYDGTEKITQLNRPVESNIQDHVDKMTEQLFSELGLTLEVFLGTADEKTMLNYYNRTIGPILTAITDEIKRKFLTKTARTQGQSIMFFIDHFKLVPTSEVGKVFDIFGRNAVLTSNEMRAELGYKPSNEPMANELVNSNNMSYQPESTAEEPVRDPLSIPVKDL